MAEFNLSYTAEDINTKLGKIDTLEQDVNKLNNKEVVLYTKQELTAEQKAQVRANIGAAEDTILELVDSIEDCVDTSRQYVLPDGYVYAWTYSERVVESKNHILSSINSDGTSYNDGLGYKTGYRLNSSGVETAYSGAGTVAVSGFIPYDGETVELRIPTTVIYGGGANYLHLYDSNFNCIKVNEAGAIIDGSYRNLQSWCNANGVTTYDPCATYETEGTTMLFTWSAEAITSIAGVAYIRVSTQVATTSDVSYFDLALNEGVDDSEVVADYSWQNTGKYYGSADSNNKLGEIEEVVNTHEEKLTDHENRLSILEADNGNNSGDVSSDDIPDYWKSELEAKSSAIQTAMEKAGRKKSAFLWYTDAHWVNGNSKVSPKLLNYLYEHTPMNKVNFGGDIIGDTLLETRDEMEYLYEWRKAIKGLPNHHSVFGNHDNFNLDTVDYEDENYRYAFLLAPEETNDMVMGDGNYYYMDNHAEKTRYLYLDYIASNQTAMMAQGQFMVDAIKGVSEGWHIVAIAHRWWQYSSSSTPLTGSIPNFEKDMLSVFDAYNARATRSGSNYFYEQDFAEAKGKVEFCIGGHIHVDYDFRSDGGIPIIITTADTNQNRVPDSTVDSGTVGTTTEAAVFGIIADYNDANNTKITVVGVGRGTSRVVLEHQTPETPVPTWIYETTYSGDTTVGSPIDISKIGYTVNYSDGSSVKKTGGVLVSVETIQNVGENLIGIGYEENGVYKTAELIIIGTPPDIVPVSISNIAYVGELMVGDPIIKESFTFNVNYSDGSSKSVTGASSITPDMLDGESVTVIVSYTEYSTTVTGEYLISNKPQVKLTSISNLTYSGDTTVGAEIDKSMFSFTANYSDGSSKSVNSATSVSPATIDVVGDNTVTITYTDGGVTVSGTITIVGISAPVERLLSFNRDYVAGTSGASMTASNLDESKAYTNVAYGNLGFNAKACAVADASETGITITEPGTGGIVVSFPVHLPDIATQKYKLSFDHTGNGKTRVYYKHLKADGTFGANQIAMDTTSGGHADLTISDGASLFGSIQIGEWLVISVGANTGKTTTISNVSLTKAE